MAGRGFTLIFLIVVNFSPGNAGKCVCIEPIMSGSNRTSLTLLWELSVRYLERGFTLKKKLFMLCAVCLNTLLFVFNLLSV